MKKIFLKFLIIGKMNLYLKKWEKLVGCRQQVNIAIEEKEIKKKSDQVSEADVEIALPKSEFDLLKEIDAKELFITSNVLKIF